MKSGKVEIEISAEFEDELLVVQTARSEALERINREIIESVKFRFLEGDIVNRQYEDGDTALMDIRTLQEGLETLDTEEATYVLHFARNTQELSINLKNIDHDLNVMRNHGRNAFLETRPANFTRLLHDYTDERKGFVSWKARKSKG